MKKLFSNLFEGRIRRREYILGVTLLIPMDILVKVILMHICFGLVWVWGNLSGHVVSSSGDVFLKILVVVSIILPDVIIYIFLPLSLSIRRFHDLNKSGWYSLLFLVPIANLFILFYLPLAGGYKEANNYGQPVSNTIWKNLLGVKK